jgi:hypothetical protein
MLHNLDSDSSKIIEAVRSTGVVVTEAMRLYVDYIVSNMKAIGTWQLSNAVYGFVGGTAASHKFNWKDLRDVDAAFRLTYGGVVTHSANGMQGNGTTGFADTKLNASILTIGNTHLSLYGQSVTLNSSFDIGVYNPSQQATQAILLSAYYGGNVVRYDDGGDSNSLRPSTSSFEKYVVGTRNGNIQRVYQNGRLIGERTASGGVMPNATFYLMAMNASGFSFLHSTRILKYVTIGSGLTDTQATQQSQIVTNAQNILNRA